MGGLNLEFTIERINEGLSNKWTKKRIMQYAFITDPKEYQEALVLARKLKRVKIKIHQPPTITISASGIDYDHFRDILTQAALHNYSALKRLETNTKNTVLHGPSREESEKYHRESLLAIKSVKEAFDKGLKEHNNHFKTYDQLTPKQKAEARKTHKCSLKELRSFTFKKERNGKYYGYYGRYIQT